MQTKIKIFFVCLTFITLLSNCTHCIYKSNIRQIERKIDRISNEFKPENTLKKEKTIQKIEIIKELALELDIYTAKIIKRELKDIIKDKQSKNPDQNESIYERLDSLENKMSKMQSKSH